jgi:photosystem II stability/assembly factor-like uncharacterized protein
MLKNKIIAIPIIISFLFIGCQKESAPIQPKAEEQQEEFWQITGFPKLPVRSIISTANGNLFAASGYGIWRSIDSGNTWESSLDMPIEGFITASPEGYIYATAFNMIWITNDYGSRWIHSNSGLSITVDTNTYAVSPYSITVTQNGDVLVGTLANGIFKSTNRGISWYKTDFPFPDRDIRSIHVTPQNVVFAGANFRFNVILRSTDNGSSWIELPGLTNKVIYSISSDSLGNIYAGGSRGMYRSNDNGEHWTEVAFVESIVTSIVKTASGKIYAGVLGEGVFCSSDLGSSWQPVNSSNLDLGILCLLIDNCGYLFAGTNNGIYKSKKSGFQ